MSTPRKGHTLTLLQNGKALAAGGCDMLFCNDAIASAEMYDPASATWSSAGAMNAIRTGHTATLLANGKVLVAGGCTFQGTCSGQQTAELYDPGNGSWTLTGSLSEGRYNHAATLLADGRVLVSGGISVCNSQSCDPIAGAEIYDPQTGLWTRTATMPAPRIGHTLTLLGSGKVLIAGGCSNNGLPCSYLGALLFDPSGAAWSGAGSMIVDRTQPTATPLLSGNVLVAGGISGSGFAVQPAEQYSPAANAWSPAGNTTTGRFGHTATRLASGDVLVAGGQIGTAEIYNHATGTWTATGSLIVSRTGHQAVLLQTGNVLVAGGADQEFNPLASAELYHPGATPLVSLDQTSIDFGLQEVGTTSPARGIVVTNQGSAALLVLLATVSEGNLRDFSASNGCGGALIPPGASCSITVRFSPQSIQRRSATLLVFDNAPDSPQAVGLIGFGFREAPYFWAPAASMKRARQAHTATLLPFQLLVLVAGGSASPSAELYNPITDSWQLTSPMKTTHVGHTATLLQRGKVLVAGGGTAASELFDPGSGEWRLVGSMSAARAGHTATLLPSGKVLVAGGCVGGACVTAELYNPLTFTWSPAAPMHVARVGHTASLLASGKVLVAGGGTSSAELYDPDRDVWTLTGSMSVARTGHTATFLDNDKVLVTGGCNGDPCRSAELYNPLIGAWTSTSNMKVPRVSHAAALLADGRVLVSGGTYFCDPEFGFCFSTPSAEIYTPATRTWTRTFPMIQPRVSFPLVLLNNGKVLAEGGYNDELPLAMSSAELFTP